MADNMELEGGTIDSGTAATTLTVFTADATITLGDNTASDADANLELSDAELETITTTSGIVVGATNAGDITVRHEDPIDLDDVNLTLITGGSIGDNGNAAATITLRDTGGVERRDPDTRQRHGHRRERRQQQRRLGDQRRGAGGAIGPT